MREESRVWGASALYSKSPPSFFPVVHGPSTHAPIVMGKPPTSLSLTIVMIIEVNISRDYILPYSVHNAIMWCLVMWCLVIFLQLVDYDSFNNDLVLNNRLFFRVSFVSLFVLSLVLWGRAATLLSLFVVVFSPFLPLRPSRSACHQPG